MPSSTKIPKAGENSKACFKSLVPQDSSVTMRPMLGNVAAFYNGNMFAGLYNGDFFLRLSAQDVKELVESKTTVFFLHERTPDEGICCCPEKLGQRTKQDEILVLKIA
jgi:hypothetical protein